MSLGESRALIEAASQSSDVIAGRLRQAVEPRRKVEQASQRMGELIAELGIVARELEDAYDETYEAVNNFDGSEDIANLRSAAVTLEGASGELGEQASSLAEHHESTRQATERATSAKDTMIKSVAAVTQQAEAVIEQGRVMPDVEALEEESAISAYLSQELSSYAQRL